MKASNLILFLLIPIISFSQNFKLNGEFSGQNTDELVLRYIDIDGKHISDTLEIKNNKFQATGNLEGVQKVLLTGNIQSGGMEDPNLGYFFIEPGNIEVQVEEDNFKEIKIVGSNSQKEFEKVKSKTKPIRLKLDSISNNKSANSNDLLIAGNEKIQKIELNYAIENPESSLSPYFLNFYQRSIPIDSVQNIFSSFSANNKQSLDGKKIHSFLKKMIVKVDDAAPDFNVVDISGNKLSLDSFKGKYLLIDFWADWCKPCIAKFPEVKSLINEYSDKGLEVLFVSFDETEDDWKKGVKKYDLNNWDHTFVGFNNIDSKESIGYQFDIKPIPAYILIDPNGKIIGRFASASKEGKTFIDLKEKLETLLN